MKKQRRPEPQEQIEIEPSLDNNFSDEPEDFEIQTKDEESKVPETKAEKKQYRIVLVSPSYIVYDFNGTNSFIERAKIDNKNPHIGEYIEI